MYDHIHAVLLEYFGLLFKYCLPISLAASGACKNSPYLFFKSLWLWWSQIGQKLEIANLSQNMPAQAVHKALYWH